MRAPLLLPLLLCTACGSGAPSPTTPGASGPGAASELPSAPASAASSAQRALAASVNQLSVALYGQLRGAQGNLVVSPASLAMALMMTWGGARGDTAAEMAAVLHLGEDTDAVLAAAGALLAVWNDPGRTRYTLRVANRLFGEQTYTFQPEFLTRTERLFGAPLEALDFQKQAEAGRARINGWVEDQTEEKIKDLIPPGGVDDQTRLALVNAIYLLADWELPFESRNTRPAPFYLAGGASKEVQTMFQVEAFRYHKADGVAVLEMPYVGGDLAMFLVLPDTRDGLPAVEEALDASKLSAWFTAAKHQRVRVWLPRFTIDPTEPMRLSEPLIALGMARAFDRVRADFTGIADPPHPDDRLFISQVFHKAFIKVNEQGTEAAAASAVVMARAGSAPPAAPPPEFRADHPFLFFLQDSRSGMILFAGRVVDPA